MEVFTEPDQFPHDLEKLALRLGVLVVELLALKNFRLVDLLQMLVLLESLPEFVLIFRDYSRVLDNSGPVVVRNGTCGLDWFLQVRIDEGGRSWVRNRFTLRWRCNHVQISLRNLDIHWVLQVVLMSFNASFLCRDVPPLGAFARCAFLLLLFQKSVQFT